MFENKEVNNRQANIVPDFTNSIGTVIGLGGIGSWVAIDLALIGYKTLFLFDPDVIESSNLNRTLFRWSDVDKSKVDAIEELILERRPDITILKKQDVITKEDVADLPSGIDIFDCTDNMRQRSLFKGKRFNNYIKFGYDGFYMTLINNDFDSGSWGSDESSYRFIPSFFGSPQIISAIGITEMINNKNTKVKDLYTVSLDCREILKNQESLNRLISYTNSKDINELLSKFKKEKTDELGINKNS